MTSSAKSPSGDAPPLAGSGDGVVAAAQKTYTRRLVEFCCEEDAVLGQPEIAEDCEVLDNVASEHLRLLQRCGFLGSERDGRRVYYHVAEPHLEQLMACIAGRFLNNSNELT